MTTHSRFQYNQLGSSEWSWLGSPIQAWRNQGGHSAIIYCHGSGGTATKVTSGDEFGLCMGLVQAGYVVVVGDWGGESWGNDTGTNKIDQAVTWVKANLGVDGPVGLIGTSMGGAVMANYARRFPSKVAAMAGIIPLTDIADVLTNLPSAIPALDAAYPPAYVDADQGQTYSPIHMAENDLLPENLPYKIWSLPSDTLTTYASHQEFVSARPQTELTTIDAPGVYHGPIAVKAVQNEVIDWMKKKVTRT